MAKKEDLKTHDERVAEGKAIVGMFKEIIGNKELLNDLLQDDEDESELDPEIQEKLLTGLRELASQSCSGLRQSLNQFQKMNQLFFETVWLGDETNPDDIVIADMLENIDELELQPFAPWMHAVLEETCSAVIAADDDLGMELACGAVNVLGGIANILYGDDEDTEDVIDSLVADEESFRAWWDIALVMIEAPSPFTDQEDEDDESESHFPREELNVYSNMAAREKLDWLYQTLEQAGAAPILIDDEVEQSVIDEDYLDLGAALCTLVPARSGSFYVEPFGAYTDDELRNFFLDLWLRAAEITQGEWQLSDLSVELSEDGEETLICVRFFAFGKTHEWFYNHYSSYADTSWFDDINSFADEFLSGRYVIDKGNELACAYVYLPNAVARRLDVLVEA